MTNPAANDIAISANNLGTLFVSRLASATDLVATSHRLFDLATPVRAEAAAMSDAEKPWPAEYATALDAVIESARLLAVAVHELTVLAFPPRLPLCADCVDGIGGACAGPDADWRPALPGESCGAADCRDAVAVLSWRSADGQASLCGGEHAADIDKTAEAGAFLRDLLAQCATDAERASIAAGRVEWAAT
tara:strand:- start:472 stop:1044 length:573 start_codon:yes stop_codon:yes gene_type:complete